MECRGENGFADSGSANGPHVHEYLKEMNRRVLSKYDLITVGEAAGVTVDEAKKYANADDSELNMVFQFEHVGGGENQHPHFGKWDERKCRFLSGKLILQNGRHSLMAGRGTAFIFQTMISRDVFQSLEMTVISTGHFQQRCLVHVCICFRELLMCIRGGAWYVQCIF